MAKCKTHMQPRETRIRSITTWLLVALTISTSVISSAEEISTAQAMADSITVYPDGLGLPSGQGSAREGKVIYERVCAACHGSDGKSGINAALVGGLGALDSATPQRTVGSFWPYATTLFDYVRRAMPYNAPGSLSTDELYAITAYVLFMNTIVEADAVLDNKSLPLVTMPNAQGFRFTLKDP